MPLPNLETNDINQLRNQFEAWQEGAVSRCKGMPLHKNPYPSRSAKGDSWENGWETIDGNIEPQSQLQQKDAEIQKRDERIREMVEALDTSNNILLCCLDAVDLATQKYAIQKAIDKNKSALQHTDKGE